MAVVEDDVDRIRTRSLQHRSLREWDQHRHAERDIRWHAGCEAAEVHLASHFRQDWIAVGVDDVDAQRVIGLGLGSVVGELRDQDDAENRRKLRPRQDRDAAAEDEQLALRDLRAVRKERVIEFHRYL